MIGLLESSRAPRDHLDDLGSPLLCFRLHRLSCIVASTIACMTACMTALIAALITASITASSLAWHVVLCRGQQHSLHSLYSLHSLHSLCAPVARLKMLSVLLVFMSLREAWLQTLLGHA